MARQDIDRGPTITWEVLRGRVNSMFTELYSAFSAKVKHTVDGGIAVRLGNSTGAESVKGELVTPSSTTENAVELCSIDIPNCVGVVLDSGVAVGEDMWVVVSGIADVYFSTNTAQGQFARIPVSGDAAGVAGQAIAEAFPSPPFDTDKHFGEIGHVLESRTGAGLAKCVLHFN